MQDAKTLDEAVNKAFPELNDKFKQELDRLSGSFRERNFGKVSSTADTYVQAAHRFASDYILKSFIGAYQTAYELFESLDTYGKRRTLSPEAKVKHKQVRKLFRVLGFYVPQLEIQATGIMGEIYFLGNDSFSKTRARFWNNPNRNFVKYHNLFSQLANHLDQIAKTAREIGWDYLNTDGYFLALSEQTQKLSTKFKARLLEYMLKQYQ